MLDDRNRTNSYKLLWIKVIIDEIILGNKEIKYKSIVCRMISMAWYPIVEYKLNFGLQDQLRILIEDLKNRRI